VSGGQQGILFDLANNQYADVAGLDTDPNADFTVFVAANLSTATPTNDMCLFNFGSSTTGTEHLSLWQRSNTGNLQLRGKDSAGTNTFAANLTSANFINGDGLYMIQRSGNTFRIECLTNGQFATDTPTDPPNFTLTSMDHTTFGARYQNGSLNSYFSGTIYAALGYTRAMTDPTEKTDVQSWMRDVRGLASV